MDERFVLTRGVVIWLSVAAIAALGLRRIYDFASPVIFVVGISLLLFVALSNWAERIGGLRVGVFIFELSKRDGLLGLAGVVLMVAAWI